MNAIVTKEIKNAFDASLSAMLSKLAAGSWKAKPHRKSLKITHPDHKDAWGEIVFDYLGGQKAYYFAMMAWSPDLASFIQKAAPPYKSNRPEGFDHHFSMSTLMEDRGVYSRADGKVFLPPKESGIEEVTGHIEECLTAHYIPWLMDFLDFSPRLAGHVAKHPDFYAYPVPTIAYMLDRNSMAPESLPQPLGKKVIRNKAFDTHLLANARQIASS